MNKDMTINLIHLELQDGEFIQREFEVHYENAHYYIQGSACEDMYGRSFLISQDLYPYSTYMKEGRFALILNNPEDIQRAKNDLKYTVLKHYQNKINELTKLCDKIRSLEV